MAVKPIGTTALTWGSLLGRGNREPIDATQLNYSYTDLLWELNQRTVSYQIGTNNGGSGNYYVGLITAVPYVNEDDKRKDSHYTVDANGNKKLETIDMKGPWYVSYKGTDKGRGTAQNKYGFVPDGNPNTYYADRIVLKQEMDYTLDNGFVRKTQLGTYYTGVGHWYDSYTKSKTYANGLECPDGVYFPTTSYAEIFNDYTHNVATGNFSHSEGKQNTVNGEASHAEGYGNTINAIHAHAEGHTNTVSADDSHAEGQGNSVSGEYAHAEGYHTNVLSNAGHAEGNTTIVSAVNAHAEGNSTYVHSTAENSHAEGTGSYTKGANAHAENSSYANGKNSHSGGEATAGGVNSFAHGVKGTLASGVNSVAFVSGTASGSNSIVFNGTASGSNSIALNNGNASGEGSVAMNYSKATGKGSVAIGLNTIASGEYSLSHGHETIISGNYSVGLGQGIKVSSNTNVSTGKYNKDEASYFAVGIGTSDTNRKNAFWISQGATTGTNGVGYFSNNTYIYGNTYDPSQYPNNKEDKSWSVAVTYNMYRNSYTYLYNTIDDKFATFGTKTYFTHSIDGLTYTPTTNVFHWKTQIFDKDNNIWPKQSYSFTFTQANHTNAGVMSAEDKRRLDSIKGFTYDNGNTHEYNFNENHTKGDNLHSFHINTDGTIGYTGWTQGFKYTNNESTVTLSYTHYTGNDSSINIPVLNDGNTINQGSANASKAGIVTADQYNKIVSRLTYLEKWCMWQSGLPNNKSTYIWSGTLAQFNSLTSKPENTTFIISN